LPTAATATIMLPGDTCTHGCRFCAIQALTPPCVLLFPLHCSLQQPPPSCCLETPARAAIASVTSTPQHYQMFICCCFVAHCSNRHHHAAWRHVHTRVPLLCRQHSTHAAPSRPPGAAQHSRSSRELGCGLCCADKR
jgi:hypothetical protein